MLRFICLPALIALTLTGCTARMVGGRCDYETIIGTALIRQEQDGALARFSPAGKGFAQSEIRFSPEMDFQVRQPTDSERDDIQYPARLDVISKGSCTPYRFELLSSEYFSRGSFLPFDHNGKVTIGAQKRLVQIAEVYQRLSPQWPNLVVDLCGQSDSDGPADYNLGLATHYAEQVAAKLTERGIPVEKLNQSGAGEDPCPSSHIYFDEVEHGVWASFLLTGIDRLSQADIFLAEQGDVQAQVKILQLINAESTSGPDQKLAIQWVAKAAQGANPEAQFELGRAYLWGNGVASDVTYGVNWIKTAAYNDYPPAQRELGWMYYHGDIIEQDHARSYAWFLIAAENGDREAQQEVREYEKYVETALEYSTEDLEAGKAISQSLKMTIKEEQPL